MKKYFLLFLMILFSGLIYAAQGPNAGQAGQNANPNFNPQKAALYDEKLKAKQRKNSRTDNFIDGAGIALQQITINTGSKLSEGMLRVLLDRCKTDIDRTNLLSEQLKVNGQSLELAQKFYELGPKTPEAKAQRDQAIKELLEQKLILDKLFRQGVGQTAQNCQKGWWNWIRGKDPLADDATQNSPQPNPTTNPPSVPTENQEKNIEKSESTLKNILSSITDTCYSPQIQSGLSLAAGYCGIRTLLDLLSEKAPIIKEKSVGIEHSLVIGSGLLFGWTAYKIYKAIKSDDEDEDTTQQGLDFFSNMKKIKQ